MSIVDKFKEETKFADRKSDKGIVNENTGSSLLIKGNGDIVVAANSLAQYKLNHDNSTITEVSLQSTTITNRKALEVDEVLINNHKLNPQLYEMADMKVINGNQAAGNLTMFSTVLVKAWEPALGRYVLIRRLMRTPLFSPLIDAPDAPKALAVTTDTLGDLQGLR